MVDSLDGRNRGLPPLPRAIQNPPPDLTGEHRGLHRIGLKPEPLDGEQSRIRLLFGSQDNTALAGRLRTGFQQSPVNANLPAPPPRPRAAQLSRGLPQLTVGRHGVPTVSKRPTGLVHRTCQFGMRHRRNRASDFVNR